MIDPAYPKFYEEQTRLEQGKDDAARPCDAKKYSKNYSRAIGLCRKCNKFIVNAACGKHCKLPINKYCDK